MLAIETFGSHGFLKRTHSMQLAIRFSKISSCWITAVSRALNIIQKMIHPGRNKTNHETANGPLVITVVVWHASRCANPRVRFALATTHYDNHYQNDNPSPDQSRNEIRVSRAMQRGYIDKRFLWPRIFCRGTADDIMASRACAFRKYGYALFIGSREFCNFTVIGNLRKLKAD